jgi:glycerol kinase
MMKSIYGTGCLALLNTGDTAAPSKNRLLTAIASQRDGEPTYALEGWDFVADAVVQWLAEAAAGAQNAVLVPAFVGLGATYWNAECCGAVFGLKRGLAPRKWHGRC